MTAAKTYAIDGVVLRSVPYGENDMLVTLLTEREGRITVIAKGARSMRSKIIGGIQPYTYANFEIAGKSGPGWIRSILVHESFTGMRAELLPLTLAQYLSDVAIELSGEGVPAGELLPLLLNTFYLLSVRIDGRDEGEILRVKSVFELRSMAISGYLPDLSGCSRCGTENIEDAAYLDVMNGSYLCASCFGKALDKRIPIPDPHETGTANILLPMSAETLHVMRYILEAPPKRIFSFRLSGGDVAENLSRITESYLLHHLERSFDSLSFFRTMLQG